MHLFSTTRFLPSFHPPILRPSHILRPSQLQYGAASPCLLISLSFNFRIDNDIAIVRLSKDVEFNANVVPACLPTNKALTYADQNAIVSGEEGHQDLQMRIMTQVCD